MRDMIERGMKSRRITVKREALLETVKTNRVAHIEAYEQAMEGYREELRNKLIQHAVKIKAFAEGIDKGSDLDDLQANPGRETVKLTQPESHEKSYDAAISMLEMEVREEIDISTEEHACYVMDDWDWKSDFRRVSSSYIK